MNDIPLTLNYARLTLFDRAGTELKRVEVGTSEIVAQAGSNFVTKERTLAFTIVFKYTPQAADSFTMLLSAIDANGNVLDASLLTNSRWRPDPEL